MLLKNSCPVCVFVAFRLQGNRFPIFYFLIFFSLKSPSVGSDPVTKLFGLRDLFTGVGGSDRGFDGGGGSLSIIPTYRRYLRWVGRLTILDSTNGIHRMQEAKDTYLLCSLSSTIAVCDC